MKISFVIWIWWQELYYPKLWRQVKEKVHCEINNAWNLAANSGYENQSANTGDANAGSKGGAEAAQRENAQGDKNGNLGNININIYTPGTRESDSGPAAVVSFSRCWFLREGFLNAELLKAYILGS